jgi:chemotaxis signal transduction protein
MSAAEHTGGKSYVLLQIGDRRFAMSAENVSELAPPVRLHEFPHTTPLVAGVIVRRGRIVPVYEVSSVLTGKRSSAHRFYLIARRNFGALSESSAIPVSGECELATAEIQPPSADGPEYISGSLMIGEERIDVLDMEALVTSRPIEANEAAQRGAQ